MFKPQIIRDLRIESFGRCGMKNKQMVVRCTYSDTDQTLAELIKESFRGFLQKELFALAIRQPM